MPTNPDDATGTGPERSGARPLRTTILVWLSVLLVTGALVGACGAVIAWLVVATAPN
jgi:hypothetical protein